MHCDNFFWFRFFACANNLACSLQNNLSLNRASIILIKCIASQPAIGISKTIKRSF